MKPSFLLSIVLSGLFVAAIPNPGSAADPHVLHEKRNGDPIAWRKYARAVGHERVPVRVALKQRNLEHADRFVDEISHPHSPRYGQHWTAEQVANMFAPSKVTSDRTVQWLVASGIDEDRLSFSTGRNWVEFDATVAEAERLLNTEYHLFENTKTGGHRLACDFYSLPKSMRDHVDFVMPTVHLDSLEPSPQAPRAPQRNSQFTGLEELKDCQPYLTIECLREIYNFGPGNYSHKGNEIGIFQMTNYLSQPDLKIFFENYTSPKIPSDTFPEFVSIDGGKHSNLTVDEIGKTFESAIDFQLAYSIIYPQGARLYQVGDAVNVDGSGTFNVFLDALDGSYCTYMGGDQPYLDPQYPDPNEGGYLGPLQCGGAPLSNIISFSYGQIEAGLPRFYQQRQCHEWMKLGLQGVSILFGSGDSGVANAYNTGEAKTCVDVEQGYVTPSGKQFSPSFPGNCPYITTVGATQLKNKASIHDGEVAAYQPDIPYYSAGGFSEVFPRPSYQNWAVENYLQKYAPDYPEYAYNRSGRGFPDVSALGWDLAIVYQGELSNGGGTSAAAPLFASILTLINEERLKAGKKTVGLVNPVLYQHPEMFNDITEGSNPGCGTKGFSAVPGWDPVTGLGTPNYEKMKKVFMSLP